jgi:peptidoglycan-associated lipoprotein
MLRRRGVVLLLVLLPVLALIALEGCAKQPATTQAAAPAAPAPPVAPPTPPPAPSPPPAAAPPAPAPAPAPPPAATPTPAPAPAPPPKPAEFAATENLRDIYFDFDKYNIRPGDARTLDSNAAWLKSNTNQLVLIEGHCDERGTSEYNLALGERRAKSTMNYLVSQGVEAGRITIISYGKERPTCTESNEGCWQRNRRAHFLVKAR